MLFGIHSLCCWGKVTTGPAEEGGRRREWGNTLRRLNGQASELEAVSEGAKTRFRVWLGTEGL